MQSMFADQAEMVRTGLLQFLRLKCLQGVRAHLQEVKIILVGRHHQR